MVYYNEIDPKAAAWLRELIKQGHIADGHVDERSIVDVKPEDLLGYTQCHFFAGIGVWSYALRQAGWSDDRPVWTGSCPCQPFSTAGKGKGLSDERHLWPEMFRLISECNPNAVFGEQVASKAGIAWLDDVQLDLEREDYACGAIVFPACSVGSPHQRQRTYWVAESLEQNAKRNGRSGRCDGNTTGDGRALQIKGHGASDQLGNGDNAGPQRRVGMQECTDKLTFGAGSMAVGVAESELHEHRREVARSNGKTETAEKSDRPRIAIAGESGGTSTDVCRPAPTNGLWRNVDWLYCRDGKWRPVEPGTFPLAHGAAERVGRLRGYGNAIVAEQAKIFIETAELAFRALWQRFG